MTREWKIAIRSLLDLRSLTRLLAAITVVATPMLACAEATGVFLSNVHETADPPMLLDVVKSTFLGRGWAIESVDKVSVSGSLEGARLRIYIAGTSLMYEEHTPKLPSRSMGIGPMPPDSRTVSIERWKNNLRKDLGVLLTRYKVQQAFPAQAVTPKESVAERLKTLESLKAAGLVTEAEYQKKREDILNSL